MDLITFHSQKQEPYRSITEAGSGSIEKWTRFSRKVVPEKSPVTCMLLVSANLAQAQSMIGIYFLPAFFAEAEVEAAVAEVETAAPPADEVVDMDTTPDPSSTPAIQPALPIPDPCTDDKIEEKERTTTPEPPASVVSSEIVVAEDASTEEETETLAKDSDEVGVEKPESSDVESLSKPAVKSDDVGEDETKKVAQEEKEEEVLLV